MKKKIAVFCGSLSGSSDRFEKDAFRFGQLIASEGFELVFGGGKDGLMGAVANGALAAGGKVTGVLPQFFNPREVAHPGMQKTVQVKNLAERKQIIAEISDVFVSLPGGIGTLDEMFEMLALSKLNRQHKISALLNTENYFEPILQMLDKMEKYRFSSPVLHRLLWVEKSPEEMMEKIIRHMG